MPPGARLRGREPLDGRAHRHRSQGRPRGRAGGDRRRARVIRLRRLGGDGSRRARADHEVGGRQVHRARGRAGRARVTPVGHDDPLHRHRGDRLLHQPLGLLRPAGRPPAPGGARAGLVPHALLQLRAARADGRVRRHRAVELPAGDGGVEARAGARDGQQRGAQAGVEHAAHGSAAGRAARRDRPAQGRGQRDHRRRATVGRGAGVASRRGQGLLHGIHRRRPADHAAGLRHDQEVHAGAGRQVAEHRVRGRRTSRRRWTARCGRPSSTRARCASPARGCCCRSRSTTSSSSGWWSGRSSIKVGDALDYDSDMGPLVSAEQFETVSNYVRIGQEEGAKLRARRRAPGRRPRRRATTSSPRSSPTWTTR